MVEPLYIKAVFLIFAMAFFLSVKQDYAIYFTILLIHFPIYIMGVATTSNAVILLLCACLIARRLMTGQTVISFNRITSNPFFWCSLLILCCYILAFCLSLSQDPRALRPNINFVISIFCILIFSNLLVGYVSSRTRLAGILGVLLFILLANAFAGLVFMAYPTLGTHVSGFYFASGNVLTVAEDFNDYTIRFGGLNLRWEEYAEYLLMALTVISALLTTAKRSTIFKLFGSGLWLLLMVELLLTNTRAPVILAVLAVFYILLFKARYGFAIRVGSFALFAVVALGCALVAASTGHLTLGHRFTSLAHVTQFHGLELPVERAAVWIPAALQVISQGFLGSGPSFIPISSLAGGFGKLDWPHSLPLIILCTVGFYGFLAYALLFFRTLASSRTINRIQDDYCRSVFIGLRLALLVFLIDSLKFDGFLRGPDAYFYCVWTIIAFSFTCFNFDPQRVRA